MKKFIIAIAALFAFTAVSAQQITPQKIRKAEPAGQKIDLQKMNQKTFQWFNPAIDLLDQFYGSFDAVNGFVNPILVDSSMVYISSTDQKAHHVFTNHVGAVCDPYSSFYPNAFSDANGYVLDSLYVGGYYGIANGNVTDTLIFEIVHNQPETNPTFRSVYIPNTPDTTFFSPPSMMGSTTLQGWEAKLTDPNVTVIKKPISVSDSSNSIHAVDVNPDLNIPAGEIMGVSISFKPGYAYSFGDTMYDYTTQSPVKNSFRAILYQTDDTQANPDYFYDPFADQGRWNLSYSIYNSGRYGIYSNTLLNEIMYPHTSMGYYIGFKLEEVVSVEENTGMEMNIYPNPVVNQVNVNVEDYQNATLEIYNLLGEVVKSEELSSNRTSINVSGLTNGTYLVRVMNGEKVSTKKIIISK